MHVHPCVCVCMCVHVVVWLLNSIPMDCSPPGSSVHGIFQEYWSGLPFSSPGDLPNPGIELRSPSLWADFLPSEPQGNPNMLKYVYSN